MIPYRADLRLVDSHFSADFVMRWMAELFPVDDADALGSLYGHGTNRLLLYKHKKMKR